VSQGDDEVGGRLPFRLRLALPLPPNLLFLVPLQSRLLAGGQGGEMIQRASVQPERLGSQLQVRPMVHCKNHLPDPCPMNSGQVQGHHPRRWDQRVLAGVGTVDSGRRFGTRYESPLNWLPRRGFNRLHFRYRCQFRRLRLGRSKTDHAGRVEPFGGNSGREDRGFSERPTVTLNRLKLGTLIVVVILLIVFMLQNQSNVGVQLLFFSFRIPESILFAVLLLAGFVMGVYVGQRIRSRSRKDESR